MKVGDLVHTLPTHLLCDNGIVINLPDPETAEVLWSDGEVWCIHTRDIQLLCEGLHDD